MRRATAVAAGVLVGVGARVLLYGAPPVWLLAIVAVLTGVVGALLLWHWWTTR